MGFLGQWLGKLQQSSGSGASATSMSSAGLREQVRQMRLWFSIYLKERRAQLTGEGLTSGTGLSPSTDVYSRGLPSQASDLRPSDGDDDIFGEG